MSADARRGLTLVEMVVVLAILAVLTTVAVSLTEGTVEQARFDATQRQLQAISDAVYGPIGQPDAPSFVADVGRLPLAGTDDDPVPELTARVRPVTLAFDFGPQHPADADVTLFAGWRGPYLTLPVGQTVLRDGWGNRFHPLASDGLTASAAGGPLERLRSDGGPASPFNVPLELPGPTAGGAWHGVVQGTVTVTSSAVPTGVTVLLHRPDAAGVASDAADAALTFAAAGDNRYAAAYSFANAPAGPVAVRAYKDYAAAAGVATAAAKGAVVYLRVPPRGTVVRDLYLTLP